MKSIRVRTTREITDFVTQNNISKEDIVSLIWANNAFVLFYYEPSGQ